MSKIISFKLNDDGYKGVTVVRVEAVQKKDSDGNITTIMDEVTRPRKLPIPASLRKTIDQLKFHYLYLTRHFQPEWREYMQDGAVVDESFKDAGYKNCVKLWTDTTITGLNLKMGIQISGKLEMLEDKIIGVPTPVVSDEDDYQYKDELDKVVREVCKAVNEYLDDKTLKLMTGDQYMMKFATDKDRENISNPEEYMIDKLTKAGYFIAGPEEINTEVDDGTSEEKEVTTVKGAKVGDDFIKSPVMDDEITIPAVEAPAGSPEAVKVFTEKQKSKEKETKVLLEDEF